ncbi:CASP-like protein 4D [Parasponia andersonii]|uniref:CASP-like protein n=1 Tax=Parasponia andersonii TaxID=3476 RepID=A0A2P5B9E8_PARAD|nr:CASP-like protein 4D [Parasponia andersonii]
MASKGINIAAVILALRIIALLTLVASVVVLLLDTYKLSDGEKTTFKDIFAYRYVISTASIVALYLILQLPLATYYAVTEKRLVRGKLLPHIDFYGDKLISLLLATGVGAGFAVTFELKKILPDAFDGFIALAELAGGAVGSDFIDLLQQERSKITGFLNMGYIAAGILLAGCVFMALVSVLSSINRTK